MRKLLIITILFAAAVFALPAMSATNGYSGSLPVIFINTLDGKAITSKTDYVSATYYIDAMGCQGFESVGTKDEPLPLEIRGRGNWTWTGFNKKPYKLKLQTKTALLGMQKNKHFALMAGADDEMAFLRNTVGYELSRLLLLPWTPEQRPVEVVLNGDYIGLYMLTETIRIDKNRVNIKEQNDGDTDAEKITGGWLMEIDNYQCDTQIRFNEYEDVWATLHSPEVLSEEQKNYITDQLKRMNRLIHSSDKSSTEWEEMIDLDMLVRYYICQEVLDDAESFHGSCYFYRDRDVAGEAPQKWMFGPVWDFGNSFRRGNSRKFIYQDPPYGQTWIAEIAKYPRFQAKENEVCSQNNLAYICRKRHSRMEKVLFARCSSNKKIQYHYIL